MCPSDVRTLKTAEAFLAGVVLGLELRPGVIGGSLDCGAELSRLRLVTLPPLIRRRYRLEGLPVFSRNIVISPWTCPPLRWITEANSERCVTAMLIPSTATSLIL